MSLVNLWLLQRWGQITSFVCSMAHGWWQSATNYGYHPVVFKDGWRRTWNDSILGLLAGLLQLSVSKKHFIPGHFAEVTCRTCLSLPHVSRKKSGTVCRYFSRKTFRRRVLQKIVGVSHTTHIPHISHTTHIPHISITPHISHTYPFKTYPTNTYPTNTYPTNTYPFNTYPTSTYPCNAYPFKTFASAGFAIRIPPIRIRSTRIPPIRFHAYPFNAYPFKRCASAGIANVSHQSIHIPPIRIFNTYPTSTDPFNAYPFKKFASAGMAMSMSIIAYHFIPLLLGGNGNEYRNLAFPSISLQNY